MKLYDWMIDLDPVHIIDADDGRTYATDTRVLVDCAKVDDDPLPVPGQYALRKNRPPVPARNGTKRAPDPAKLLADAVEHYKRNTRGYHAVRWSTWVDTNCRKAPHRIGSLDLCPVATWDKVVASLPADVELVGHDPDKPLLIGYPIGSTWSFFGLVSTIRLGLYQHLDPVYDEIVAALNR